MVQLSNALIVAHKFPHTPDSNCGDVYMLDMMTRCSDWQGAEENLHLVNFLGATCLEFPCLFRIKIVGRNIEVL